MIRAVMTKDNGGQAVILGVDDENVRRLTAGDPILVQGEALGIPIDIFILHGATTEAVLDKLRGAGFSVPENPQPGVAYEHSGAGYVPTKRST